MVPPILKGQYWPVRLTPRIYHSGGVETISIFGPSPPPGLRPRPDRQKICDVSEYPVCLPLALYLSLTQQILALYLPSRAGSGNKLQNSAQFLLLTTGAGISVMIFLQYSHRNDSLFTICGKEKEIDESPRKNENIRNLFFVVFFFSF